MNCTTDWFLQLRNGSEYKSYQAIVSLMKSMA